MSNKVRLLVISAQEFKHIGALLTGGGGPAVAGDAQTLHNVLRDGWTITAMATVEQHIYVSVSSQP